MAEISFVSLKNCLVNLPQSLVDILIQTNAPAQDVVIELLVKDKAASSKNGNAVQQSVYVGWSGMHSTKKPASFASHPHEQGFGKTDAERGVVDIDATFGRVLGLAEGQKVGLLLHLDPPLAHTVNIEPLTSGDWEVIELHANFLELNLLSQIRALPNPSSAASAAVQMQHSHPLTLHISPTSTANIIVTSLAPPLSASQPFARLAADAEVIVAPKTRPRRSERNGSQSVASMGRKSASGRSGRSSGQRAESSKPHASAESLLLRPCDRRFCDKGFDAESDELQDNVGLRIWVDPDAIANSPWTEASHVSISIIRPAAIGKPSNPSQQQKKKDVESSDAGEPAVNVVARLIPWHNSPGRSHAVLSSLLCSSLQARSIVGGMVKLQPAPPPLLSRSIKSILVVPFAAESGQKNDSIRFGGQSYAGHDEASRVLRQIFSNPQLQLNAVDEPMTDGFLLPPSAIAHLPFTWAGGILRLIHATRQESERTSVAWVNGLDRNITVDFGNEVTNPMLAPSEDGLPDEAAPMIGAESLINLFVSQLSHSSSVLVTGGLGSGKSALAQLLGCRLRSRNQTHVSHMSCRKLTVDELRISSVKDSMERLFSAASWAVRLGGQSLVILDDLDKLCPMITELQTQDNSRSNRISELICHIAQAHCRRTSDVTLLCTAQSQDSLNSLLIGANLFKDIITLKAPDKDSRRMLLQAMVGNVGALEATTNSSNGCVPEKHEADHADWMAGSLPPSPAPSASDDALAMDHRLDFLDVVRQTDGYMPADLALLVSRAKSEAIIRSVASEPASSLHSEMMISNQDFDRALDGFTPASLRNVTLQSSNTTFDSIGGLKSTRKTLLETLQYPTLYAPIFANCPLRLRSGLLLYGYPGCGKTLLASAVAGECGLNFISVKGPEILNKYIGASEKSVRDLFDRAESARPCVLFFDEFDSIAPKRGHDSTGVTDRVVNQLLTQMDGAEGLSGVYVLAATSRPDLIDPALLRPGRLDKSILCDLPDFDDRLDILTVISKKLKVHPEILSSKLHGLYEVAERTDGYSGADLQAVVYNAHLEAIHDELGGHGAVTQLDKKPNGANAGRSSMKSDILRFRFGKDADSEVGSTNANRAEELAEYYTILTKLDSLRQKRRAERRQGRKSMSQGNDDDATNGTRPEKGRREVVIQWKHIEASVASTRRSISPQERERLTRFYREFMIGRNGELPNGEGSTEVGGRSSLM